MTNFGRLRGKALKAGISLSIALSAGVGLTAVPTATFASSTTFSPIARNIINTGEHYLGTPYKYGSTTGNTRSFDCSSFTQYVYRLNGITIPRDSRQQSKAGSYVSRSQLQPGDLVFFYSPIHHVAIYIGNGQILHTYGSGGVRIDSLNSHWWSSHYTTARRVIPNNGQSGSQANTNIQPASRQTNTGNSITLTKQANNELNTIENLLRRYNFNSYSTPSQWLQSGNTVSLNQLKRGDVLFFSTTGSQSTIEHVGVYEGAEKILVTSSSSSATYSLRNHTVQTSFVTAKRYN